MSLWTLSTLADAAKGQLRGGQPDAPVTGVSIDTRTLTPGEAYVAIKGVSMDGHRFAKDALAKGASAVVVSAGEDAPAVVVDDTLVALQNIGIAARERVSNETPIVAVTGSVGKTGTKEMLKLAFGPHTHAAAASHNNHWGVPLTLSNMPADASAGIFEIGMNHAGEITPLTKMVRPQIAIITTVAPVHLEFFKDVAAIADAKAEIFLGLEPGGFAIIPADNAHTERLRAAAMAQGAKIVTFGASGADISLAAFDPMTGEAEALVHGEKVGFVMHAGAHIARNALAVLGALHAAGRPLDAAQTLSQWQAPRGRGRLVRLRVPDGDAVLIDEAYNANPASMAASIATLAKMPATRRIAILGDMLELGPTSGELHRGLAPLLVESGARIVHTVGTITSELRESLPANLRGEHHGNVAGFVDALPPVAAGDAILVKGSNAVQLSQVVEALEKRYGVERADV